MFLKYPTVFFIIACFSFPAMAQQSPMEQTKAFVAAMKSVKTQGEKSYSEIDAFINFDQLTAETIKPHLASFNENQVNTFKPRLQKLIRMIAYPQSGDFYSDSTYTYQAPVINNNKAFVVMNVVFKKEDLEIELGYFWENTNGQWLLVDLSFDEDSLVKDYQNQFGRIISKEGVDSLNEKLQNKIIEIETDKKK